MTQLQLVLGAIASATGKTVRVLSLGQLPSSRNHLATVSGGGAGSNICASELQSSCSAQNSEEQVAQWTTFSPEVPGEARMGCPAESNNVISLLYLFDHHFDLLTAASADTSMSRPPDTPNDKVR
jgi:hypothetical protein